MKKKNDQLDLPLKSTISVFSAIMMSLGMALAFCFSLILCVLMGIGIQGVFPRSRTDICAQENLESLFRFELPVSVENLVATCNDSGHWNASMIFEISSEDLDEFLDSTVVYIISLSSEEELRHIHLPEGVSLEAMKSYLYGQYQEYGYTQEILIDTSHPDVYTVYIEVLGG